MRRKSQTLERRKGGGGVDHSLFALLLGLIWYHTWFSTPDIFGILLNSAVTRELTTHGYVMNHHSQPPTLILGEEGGEGAITTIGQFNIIHT